MKLLTKEIEHNLPKLGANEGKKPEETPIAVKFFCPWNQWTWYATEGERQKDSSDMMFFGYVRGMENEFGYFCLSEIESVQGPGGLKIERDAHFGEHMLSEAIDNQI